MPVLHEKALTFFGINRTNLELFSTKNSTSINLIKIVCILAPLTACFHVDLEKWKLTGIVSLLHKTSIKTALKCMDIGWA